MSEEYLDPIIVTGCARSGTSVVAGILERCGAFGGTTVGPTRANPRGQYENVAIIQNVQKKYLGFIGADVMGQYPLPEYNQLVPDPERRKLTLRVIVDQGLQPGQPWYFKDAKACLDWPIWQEAFPNAHWIVVRRNKADIVRSCQRTSFMRKRKDWDKWVDFHLERFKDLQRTRRAWEIWPQSIMNGDSRRMQQIVRDLGLTWDEDAVAEFVEPALYHRSA